jgi:type IV pilus assembly protein PilO
MEQLLERLNKAPNSVKFGAMGVVVVAITVATFFLAIQPAEEQIEALIGQQSVLEKTLAEKQEIAQNLNERRKEMDELEQKLLSALSELPERRDVDELLAQLNDVGKKSGLEIASVTPGPEVAAAFYAKIPIRVAVTGNYHEIALFLQEIANLRRIVNVSNIKLGGGHNKNDKVVLSSDFLATTFRFIEQKAAPAKKDAK